MKKKSYTSAHPLQDVELPLLSKPVKGVSSPSRLQSKFMEYFDPDSSPSKYIKKISLFKFLFLADMWPLVKFSNSQSKPLTIDDLPFPFSFCRTEEKIIAIDKEWTASLARKEPSLTKALLKAYKKEIGISILLAFMVINGKWTSSLLMGSIINNISNSNYGIPIDFYATLLLTALLATTSIFMVLCTNWYWHYTNMVSLSVKNALNGYTYRKLQGVALSSLQEINIGKVINLLSGDAGEVGGGFVNIVVLFWSPYTIGAGAFFLWNFFGFATIFGILGLVLALVVSNMLSKMTISIRTEKKLITDERIKLTNELIECIRLLKMYAWEKPFKQAIEALRKNETIKLAKIRFIEALGRGISDTSSQTSMIVICLIYVAYDGILSPQKVYTGHLILGFICFWGVIFPREGIMAIGSYKVVKERFEKFLLINDIEDLDDKIANFLIDQRVGEKKSPLDNSLSSTDIKNPVVTFSNFSAWWKKDDPKPCLNNINLVLHPGQLTTVIGTIGSGKTSFLFSLLREIPLTQGTLSIKGTVAYVEQEPIIFSGTIRSNILFGLEYNDSLYNKVIRACNLNVDLQQFEDGDMVVVGERGITLSGGQKVRLSLARALYSQSDIYLLDDPLSAVDSKVGRHIFNYAIKGDLLKGKTIILATHHMNYAKESNRVLFFSEGCIVADGTFEEIRMMENNLFNKFKELEDQAEKRKASEAKSSKIKGSTEIVEANNKKQKKAHYEEVHSEVTLSTYAKYVKESDNYAFFILLVIISILSVSTGIGYSRFLGYWSQAQSTFYFEREQNGTSNTGDERFDNLPYMIIGICLGLFLIVICALQVFLSGTFLVNTNSNMHANILEKIAQARVVFFDKTPIGVILNRFTNDLGVLDSGNAILLPLIMDGTFFLIFRILTVVIVNPWILIPLCVVVYGLNKSKSVFKKAIIEVKRIELASKSPIYSEVSATINGLLAIRTFRQGGTFIKKFCHLLYNSYRGSFYGDRTLRFFSMMNMMTLESLTIMGTFACVILAYNIDLDAAIFGLILVMLQEIASYGTWYLRTSLLVDINMQSVERMLQLYQIEQEAPQYMDTDKALLKKETSNLWPKHGHISFQNMFMKYRPEFDYVLKGLTFNISAGEKVGIVGRTGAGKSSIVQVLFRMTEIDSIPGSSIMIDGVDISKIGLNMLRNGISIIPQAPVVFTGTIRRNLDPFNVFTDDDLLRALEEVNLKGYVLSLEKKLDTDMTMSNSIFSAGQKQLICLARAILRQSKIIVLDEATANVDIETDDFIQRKIMERFRDSTVITIAHRLITIANYDKVVVMDKGGVVEYDTPYNLLVKREEDQDITRTQGCFAQMVLNSGESIAKQIFRIAFNKNNKLLN